MGTQRQVRRLTDIEMAYLCEHLDDSPADIAKALGRQYWTVFHAQRRVRERGWATPLRWETCTVCGQPVCGPALPVRSPRTCHVYCEAERTRRLSRRRCQEHPGQSTPYVRAYYEREPAAWERKLIGTVARQTERWEQLGEGERQAIVERAHQADRRDQEATAELAESTGARWSGDEDDWLLQHPDVPAREAALFLGRSLWAVRGRRAWLRKHGHRLARCRPRPRHPRTKANH